MHLVLLPHQRLTSVSYFTGLSIQNGIKAWRFSGRRRPKNSTNYTTPSLKPISSFRIFLTTAHRLLTKVFVRDGNIEVAEITDAGQVLVQKQRKAEPQRAQTVKLSQKIKFRGRRIRNTIIQPAFNLRCDLLPS